MPKPQTSQATTDKKFPRVQGIITEVVGGFTVTAWLAVGASEALTLITDEPSASVDAAVNRVRALARDRGIQPRDIDLKVRLTSINTPR